MYPLTCICTPSPAPTRIATSMIISPRRSLKASSCSRLPIMARHGGCAALLAFCEYADLATPGDGIGILRGIEANIKNTDGEIDCTGPMLTSLDLILAVSMSRFSPPQDKDTNTAAMICHHCHGNVHIISHPGNPKYPIDIQAVAQAQRSTAWRWRLITPPLFTRVRAAKPTVATWRPPCVTRVAWWRWDQTLIPRLRW